MTTNGAAVMRDPVAAIQERRAARKQELAKAREQQFAKDLEALDALEAEHGDESVAALDVGAWKPGHPSIMVVKSPGGTQLYKRYTDQVRRAGKNGEAIGKAQELLGESCIVYPSDEKERAAFFDAYPGAKVSAYVRVIKFVELAAEDEKKD